MRKKILGNGDFIGGLPLKGDTAIFYSVGIFSKCPSF